MKMIFKNAQKSKLIFVELERQCKMFIMILNNKK